MMCMRKFFTSVVGLLLFLQVLRIHCVKSGLVEDFQPITFPSDDQYEKLYGRHLLNRKFPEHKSSRTKWHSTHDSRNSIAEDSLKAAELALEDEFVAWGKTQKNIKPKDAAPKKTLNQLDDVSDKCLHCGSHLKCKPGETNSNGRCVPTVSTQFDSADY